MRHQPAIRIEVKFSLDGARCAVESSQILHGLFEDTGRQFSLTGLGDIIFGSVHVGLLRSFLSQAFERRHFSKFAFLARFAGVRSALVLPVNVWPASLDRRGRIETEQENEQNEY